MTTISPLPGTSPVSLLAGLSDIADRYDGFILDLWGVIHDGIHPYPEAVACLRSMQRAGKRICLLSNAPRTVEAVIARLEEIGVPRDVYHEILTSGEASRDALRNPPDDWHARLGPKVFHLGSATDDSVLQGTGKIIVDRPEDADFCLNTGIFAAPADLTPEARAAQSIDKYEDVLQACLKARLPMICANPDLVVMVGGVMTICAGALADHYKELGGDVVYHGKPHAPVYQRCFQLLGIPDRSRILAVGDSFRTDIAGANAAGIDSVIVTGGIHEEDFGLPGKPDPLKIAAHAKDAGFQPTYAVPTFRW